MSSSITGLGIRDKTKGGWHPKGIGQVSGWMGKGKSSNSSENDHTSRPLHTLKDPSAFGPPPKNVNYHGGAALPNQITPDRRGLGAPLSREEIQAKQDMEEEEQRAIEEAELRKGPPVPFRADTSGLSTAHLPPPPGRQMGVENSIKPKPPGLPPRLPPRQNSNPSPSASLSLPSATRSEADPNKGILNQGALNRLGAAGVSVPGFGIGSKGRAPILPPPTASTPARSYTSTTAVGDNQPVNELPSRFSRLSSSVSQKPTSPSQGTTFAQKQAALKTATAFRDDPSSVSLDDARSAASTANNFRERHSEQVKSGWQSANKLNTKYGIADKVGAYSATNAAESTGATSAQPTVPNPGLGKKKPPPPPPKKKPGLASLTVGDIQSPPIPLSSKPKYG